MHPHVPSACVRNVRTAPSIPGSARTGFSSHCALQFPDIALCTSEKNGNSYIRRARREFHAKQCSARNQGRLLSHNQSHPYLFGRNCCFARFLPRPVQRRSCIGRRHSRCTWLNCPYLTEVVACPQKHRGDEFCDWRGCIFGIDWAAQNCNRQRQVTSTAASVIFAIPDIPDIVEVVIEAPFREFNCGGKIRQGSIDFCLRSSVFPTVRLLYT